MAEGSDPRSFRRPWPERLRCRRWLRSRSCPASARRHRHAGESRRHPADCVERAVSHEPEDDRTVLLDVHLRRASQLPELPGDREWLDPGQYGGWSGRGSVRRREPVEPAQPGGGELGRVSGVHAFTVLRPVLLHGHDAGEGHVRHQPQPRHRIRRRVQLRPVPTGSAALTDDGLAAGGQLRDPKLLQRHARVPERPVVSVELPGEQHERTHRSRRYVAPGARGTVASLGCGRDHHVR